MKLRFAVPLVLLLCAPLAAWAEEAETDPTGLKPPAWYENAELGETWNLFTGRYIFERTCTSCHRWGPDYWSRSQWQEYLKGFPANHEPDVAELYADLTAMFRPARYVPNAEQRTSTLSHFLLARAPDATMDEARRLAPFASLPEVGDTAPDFTITDIDGQRHQVSEYRGEKQLVLVFSRAHW